MNSEKTERNWLKSAAFRDALVIIVIGVLSVALGTIFDISEPLFKWIQEHEELEIDEFLAAVATLALCLCVYSFRRWRETQREIEEVKKQQKAREESEERLGLVSRATSDAVWDWDLWTNMVWWNEAVRTLFGYSAQEVPPDLEWWEENIHPEDRQRVISGIYGVINSGGQSWSDEYRFRRKDDTYAYVLDRGFVVRDNSSNAVRMIGSMMDITARKEAEEKEAEFARKLESANRELEDLVHMASHDLKTPLRGIKTLAEWLSTDYTDKFDEVGKEQIRLLLQRVDRMYDLIEGVLQYSRLDHAREEMVQVDLNEIISEIIETVAPPQNIEITIANNMPVIKCEKTRIIQVFQNLLINAVKFMDKPRGLIKVGCVEENGFWKFNVTDNGPGIEEKYFEKIFKVFQKLASHDETEGTGIGLTIVKKIVELYGGKVWVESKPGEGSAFFFTLPNQEMGVKNAKLETNIACGR